MKTSKHLGEIISELEKLCEAIDSTDPGSTEFEDITAVIHELKGVLTDKVDSWIGYLEGAETALIHAKKKEEEWKKRRQSLENIQTRLKNYLVFHFNANALTEIKGKEGKLKLCRNTSPKLSLSLPTQKMRYDFTLPKMAWAEAAKNYPEFLEEMRFYRVDAEAIKKALLSGRNLDFANIEFGHHVRIL